MIKSMKNINVQVRLPPGLEENISKVAASSRSSFIREAIEEKIEREKAKMLERKWIQALKGHPEAEKETAAWLKMESWGDR